MTFMKWGFICRSVQNYMEHLATHWRDEVVYLWKNEPGYVSTEYTFASPHFNSAGNVHDLLDRAVALKAVFDGAMILASLPNGRFVPFDLGLIVDLTTQSRHDHTGEGNVLVEPFDTLIYPLVAPKRIIHGHYGPEDMVGQARFDPIAKGLLRHIGHNGPDFRSLYSLLDWKETEGWTEEQVANVTSQTGSAVKSFTATANNETVLGPMARHGNKRWTAPSKPMPLVEAQRLILPAARRFLETRALEFESTGIWPKYVKPRKSRTPDPPNKP